MSSPEDKYGLLPRISESIAEKILAEVSDFASFMKHDPDGAKRSVESDVEWLKENKGFLGNAVEASVDASLDLYSETLTHKEWVELRTFLLKGVLLMIQMINEALKKQAID